MRATGKSFFLINKGQEFLLVQRAWSHNRRITQYRSRMALHWIQTWPSYNWFHPLFGFYERSERVQKRSYPMTTPTSFLVQWQGILSISFTRLHWNLVAYQIWIPRIFQQFEENYSQRYFWLAMTSDNKASSYMVPDAHLIGEERKHLNYAKRYKGTKPLTQYSKTQVKKAFEVSQTSRIPWRT